MLREYLDQGHGAASRTDKERAIQLDWLWDKLGLRAGDQVLDVTCGPGLYAVELAQRGCVVTGVDFSPASIDHARNLADARGVTTRCTFTEQDVRQFDYPVAAYGAALFLYGQLRLIHTGPACRYMMRTSGWFMWLKNMLENDRSVLSSGFTWNLLAPGGVYLINTDNGLDNYCL
jgi:SAM-dependent methyltransferase